MNRYFISILCVIFISCSNLDDVNRRLDNLENTVAVGSDCCLLQMYFSYQWNPKQLIGDINCDIINDSIVECWIPYVVEDKILVPEFRYNGDFIYLNDEKVVEGRKYDFRKPVKLSVTKNGFRKDYMVYLHSNTGLPRVYIDTENRKDIISKDEYIKATFRLVEDVVTRGAGDVVEDSILIKGRGNSSWTRWPKKPYRLKFNNKVSLFDGPKDKSYVMLANYIDKTSLRNQTAFYMGEISNLDYSPTFHFVDFFLNDIYYGTYQLGDKLKISKERVNVGDDGFLIEIDSRAVVEDRVYFYTNHLTSPINIKEPEVEYGDDNFRYIKDYINISDSVLFSPYFKDEKNGWTKYMDMSSFVDWYLINEISRNGDAKLVTSCYMNLKRGGKLKMGPLWDFDTAFGNNTTLETRPAEGFYIKEASWYARLFEDPSFVKAVKVRFDFFYSKKDDIYKYIDENAEYIRRSVECNDNRWDNIYETWDNQQNMWGGYYNEIQQLKKWLDIRLEWLKHEFDTNW